MQLEPYRKGFGSKYIMVLDFDELITNPKGLVSLVLNGLKLNSSYLEVFNVVKCKTKPLSQAEVFYSKYPV